MALKIDSNDPLFIRASDMSGANLILIKLVGSENYGVGSRSMRISLLGKRIFGLLLVHVIKPCIGKSCMNNERLAIP